MYMDPKKNDEFVDTVVYPKEVPSETEEMYSDPTSVDEIEQEIIEGEKDSISIKYATFIRQKVFGVDVRESMARFVLWISVLYNRLFKRQDEVEKKQDEVEKRQDEVEEQFKDVIANATVDSEVILARRSKLFNKVFKIIGDRGDFWDESIFRFGIQPQWFGAKGDGITDDSEAVQKCVNFSASVRMKTKIAGGTFLIKAHVDTPTNTTHYLMNEGGIRIPDGAVIEFSQDGILKPIPHDKKASNVLRTYNNKNIRIYNPNIEDNYNGEKEWNYGIAIQGGENIKIVNPEIHGFSGDGINIQRSSLANEAMYIPKNIRIIHGDLTKNGRQSISIEEVDGLYVDSTLVGQSDKNLPMSAIDIEPAWAQPQDKTVCQNIHLKNIKFADNQYNGFQIIGSHYVKNVLLEECVFANNNLSGKNSMTNKIGSCDDVVFKNCVFEEGEKIQFIGVKNIEFSNSTLNDAFIEVEQTANNVTFNSTIFSYRNLKAGMTPILVHKGAASVCELIIKDSIIDLDDDGRASPEYGILSLVTLKGMTNFTSINNVYRNSGRAIDNAFYNSDALALQFTSINDTFENIRQQAIITTAHEVRIVRPTFIGCGYETAINNGFSRDIQWNMQSNAKKLILSHAYGDKQPTNSNIAFKDIGYDNNVMLHITGSVSTAKVTGGNNICDYLVQGKSSTGSTVNSVSSTAGTLTTIHKPLDDYSRFAPNTIILILSTGQIGFINEGYKFFEFLRKA